MGSADLAATGQHATGQHLGAVAVVARGVGVAHGAVDHQGAVADAQQRGAARVGLVDITGQHKAPATHHRAAGHPGQVATQGGVAAEGVNAARTADVVAQLQVAVGVVERQRSATGAEADCRLRVEAAGGLCGDGREGVDIGAAVVPYNPAPDAEGTACGRVDAGQHADVDALGAAQLGAVGQHQVGAGGGGAQGQCAGGQARAFAGHAHHGVAVEVGRAQLHRVTGQHRTVAQAEVVAVPEGAGIVPASVGAGQVADRVDGHTFAGKLPTIAQGNARVVKEYAARSHVDRIHLRTLATDQQVRPGQRIAGVAVVAELQVAHRYLAAVEHVERALAGAADHDGITQHGSGTGHHPARTRALDRDGRHGRTGFVVGERATDPPALAGEFGAIVDGQAGGHAVAGAQRHRAIVGAVTAEGVLATVEDVVSCLSARQQGEADRERQRG